MDFTEIGILFIAVLVNFVLSGFVYLRNPRSATHQLFTLLGVTMSLWSVTNYFATNAETQFAAIWLTRGVMFFATPMSVIFFLLMHTFPHSTYSLSKKTLVTWIFLTIITMAVAMSPFLFSQVELVPGSAPKPTPGLGMILFIPIGIGTIPLGIYYLIRKSIKARGVEKIQTQFLLLGAVIMFILIISLNFISVIVFDTSAFTKFGPLFTLPFTLLAAYAIVRHRLMDIRAAAARSLSFSILIGAFALIYGAILILAVPPLAKLLNINPVIISTAGALLAVLLASYVERVLRKLTDRFLFQQQANYKKALVVVGKELSGTININDVTTTLLKAMKDTVRSKKTIILLKESKGTSFTPQATQGVRDINVSISQNHALVKHIKHSPGPLVKDELTMEKEQETSPQHITEIEEVESTFNWLDVAVVLPLYVNKKLTGLIALGDKLSGAPYMQDDINFLSALSPQAAVALKNARLYKESLEFGQKLEAEVKRATLELEVANEQLRDLDKAKSEFLSVASHQLYTPLTALRGYLSMIQEGEFGKTAPKQKPIINILEKSANRLINLIKNLLDISRIEKGRLELNLESTNIVQMTEELVKDLLPNALRKKIKFKMHAPTEQLPNIVADKERIRQVLLNTIDNAIKYTTKGRVDVTLEKNMDDIIISVTDTGRGMARDEIAKIFTKFTRVGGDARFRTEGSGLGLYVAKQIIREHHGDIEVTSPGLEKGSTFAIHFPIEGSSQSLKAGEKVSVEIKAAEAEKAVQ